MATQTSISDALNIKSQGITRASYNRSELGEKRFYACLTDLQKIKK